MAVHVSETPTLGSFCGCFRVAFSLFSQSACVSQRPLVSFSAFPSDILWLKVTPPPPAPPRPLGILGPWAFALYSIHDHSVLQCGPRGAPCLMAPFQGSRGHWSLGREREREAMNPPQETNQDHFPRCPPTRLTRESLTHTAQRFVTVPCGQRPVGVILGCH